MFRTLRPLSAAVLLTVASSSLAATSSWTDPGVSQASAVISGAGSTLVVQRSGLAPLRSVDGGMTWVAFTVAGLIPDGLAASPTDTGALYATVGGVAVPYRDFAPSRFFRSRNGGAAWESLPSFATADGKPLGNLVVGANPDLLYATRMESSFCFIGCSYTGREAYRSTDGGMTWRSVNAGLAVNSYDALVLRPSASDARVVYASTYAGAYRSDDQGDSWRNVSPNPRSPSDLESSTPAIAVDRVNPMIAYVRYNIDPEVRVTEDGGLTWRVSYPGPVDGVYRQLAVDPSTAGRAYMMGGDGEIFESRDSARTWARTAPNSDVRNLSGAPPVIVPDGPSRRVLAASGGSLRRLDLAPNSFFIGSDLWWNPAESGTGLSITQHASGQVFALWFDYDAQGRATWHYVSGGTWLDDRTFTGVLFDAAGPAFTLGAFDPTRVVPVRIGTATLRFDNDSSATFSWQLDSGARGDKPIARYLFGPRNNWFRESYKDLWWNPLESGWGVSVSHQYAKVFAILYVYDDAGRPTWYFMPDANVVTTRGMIYEGDLYSSTVPAGLPYDPARVMLARAGYGAINFVDSQTATLDWTLGTRKGQKSIVRLPY